MNMSRTNETFYDVSLRAKHHAAGNNNKKK